MNEYFYSFETACWPAIIELNQMARYSTSNDVAVALMHLEDENNQ